MILEALGVAVGGGIFAFAVFGLMRLFVPGLGSDVRVTVGWLALWGAAGLTFTTWLDWRRSRSAAMRRRPPPS